MRPKPFGLRITIFRSDPGNPRLFGVTLGELGSPDFTLEAENARAAAKALKEYLYNELDGRGTVSATEATA